MIELTPERREHQMFPPEGVAGGGDGHLGALDGLPGGLEGLPGGLLEGQAAGLFRPWDTPESLSPTSGQSISPSSSSDRTSPSSPRLTVPRARRMPAASPTTPHLSGHPRLVRVGAFYA